LDPDKTQQYIGVNFRAQFKNEVHVGIGSYGRMLVTAAGDQAAALG